MENEKELLTGNEAIARGAYEAGVGVAAAYPGTPSTEVLETLAGFKDDAIWCEWTPNEKVALEVAIGASLVGVRSMAVMKHVGLNVASDPFMSSSYVGAEGGMVVVVADDPGMHSSQNEQDTRNYARFAKIPLLEPSDSQEAKDFALFAFELSEKFKTPVILRSTTRISHCSSPVSVLKKKINLKPAHFIKNPQRYVPVPRYAREMRRKVEERLIKLREFANQCPKNRIIERGNDLGIVTSGVAFQYVMDEFPDASVLKLGLSFPFPDELIRDFASKCERLIVIEELDDFLEEHIRSLGIKAKGREYFSGIGELNPGEVAREHRVMEHRIEEKGQNRTDKISSLPARPPVFCSGCPHRGLFYALSKIDCVVTGDIGCYSLGVFPPYERMDTIICMGGGITVAQGMNKAGFKDKPLIGIVGDSTFFHSGITGLLEISYNKGISTIIIVDNRITAMTGHQDHPGTGKTLMGKATYTAYPEDFIRACGIENIEIIDPLNLKQTLNVLKEQIKKESLSVIVSRHPCALIERKKENFWEIDKKICTQCQKCLKIACPAIYKKGKEDEIYIDPVFCQDCGFCAQVCPSEAIKPAISHH